MSTTTSSAVIETTDVPTASPKPTLALIVVFVTQLMLVVDASIVNVALPAIRDELGFDPVNLSWVVTAYALAFAGLMLLSGRVGGLIGAKRALIIGTLVFIVASAIGGFAPTAEILVAARVLQGIGAALAAPSTLVLLVANTRPGTHRARAMSLFVIAAGSGGAIGLILGGVLTTNFGWEWVMFVNVPIGLIIVVGALLYLKETERIHARLDFAGAAVSSIAMVALVFGFTTAASHGWSNELVLVSFSVAVLAIATLIFLERRHSHPVVQLALVSSMRKAVPYIAMLLVPAGMFGFFYFVTLFTQNVFHFDALGTGLSLVPFVLTMMVTNQLAPNLIPRLGEKVMAVIGLALLAGGLLWLGQITPESTFLNGLLAPMLLMGVGAGFTFAPLSSIVMSQAPSGEVGAASSLLQAMQQLGGSIGVAVLTTVFVAVTSTSGEARGISTALEWGVAFLVVALAFFAIWGRRIPADSEAADAPQLH